MLLSAILAAYLIWCEIVPEASIGYLCGTVVLLGTITASTVASGLFGEKKLIISLISGGGCLLLLIIGNILTSDGVFVGFWPQCALIMGSSCAVGLIKGRGVKGRKTRTKYRLP